MSSLTEVTINGITTQAQWEYTSSEVKQRYYNDLIPLINLLNLTQSGSTTAAGQVTQQDVNDVQAAIADLQDLAAHGIQIPDITSSSGGTVTSYMSVQLANDLDLILRSLQTAGVNSSLTNINLTNLQLWVDNAVQSNDIGAILQSAQLDVQNSTRTFQSLVETVYVGTGNDVISSTLNSLDNQLSITNSVVETLTDLQNLHNQITVKSLAAFSSFFTINQSGYSNYNSDYLKAASAYFGQPITPSILSAIGLGPNQHVNASGVIVTDPGVTISNITKFQSSVIKLIEIRTSLQKEIAQLSAVSTSAALLNPDSLYSRLKTVLADINNNFTISGTTTPFPLSAISSLTLLQAVSGFAHWLIDNYSAYNDPNASLSGAIQQNITTAVTSAQSVNSSQSESVRRYLYIFQQYYQSASSMLTSLNQMITQIAQNIAR